MKNSHYTIYVFLFLATQCLFHHSPLLGVTTDTTSSKSRYSCPVEDCNNNMGKGFDELRNLESHLLNQHTKCPLCPSLTFDSKKDLHQHMTSNHSNKKIYYCATCNDFITNHSTSYKNHQKKHSGKSQNASLFDDSTNNIQNNIHQHIEDNLNPADTDFFDNLFATSFDELLLNTIQTNQGKPNHTHEPQQATFNNGNISPNNNNRTNHNSDEQTDSLQLKQNRPCSVEGCNNNKGRGFNSLRNLEKHLLNQHTKCPLCPSLTFDSKKNLHQHMTSNHPKKTIYYCATCNDFISNSSTNYKEHQNSCNPELKQTLPCSVEGCNNNNGKGFADHQGLESHLLNQHTKCPLCPSLTFDSKKDLHEHITNNHPKKPIYYCSTCNDFISNNSTNYKNHQKKHSGKSQNASLFDDSTNNIQNNIHQHIEDSLNPVDTDFLDSLCADQSLLNTIQTNQWDLDYTHETQQATLNNGNISPNNNNRKNHNSDEQTDNPKLKKTPSCPVESCDNNKGKGFGELRNLESHLLNQHTKCPLCPSLTFDSKKDLHQHMTSNHPKKTIYYCATCNDFITNSITNYKKHQNSCNPELKTTLPCTVEGCNNNKGKGFATSENLRAHLLSHHAMCPDCNSSAFHSKEELLDHLVNNHPKKAYYCNICNKYTTNNTADYNEHQNKCREKSQTTILRPGKQKNRSDDSTNNPQIIGITADTTSSKSRYSCTVESCNNNNGKGFASLKTKENHLLNQHTKCPECISLTFDSKKDLHEHMTNIHSTKPIYYCATCNDFISNNSTSYKKHQKTCNSELKQTLPCTVEGCGNNNGKGFADHQTLEKHLLNQHTKCRMCPSLIFSSKKDLHEHMTNIHSTKPIYYCSICNNLITNHKADYKKHQASHNKQSQIETLWPSKRKNRPDDSTNNIPNKRMHLEDNLNTSEIDLLNSLCSTIMDEAFLDTIQIHTDLQTTNCLTFRSGPNSGIINENGTDCFMSATLQVLSNIPAFEKFFMENAFNKNSHTGSLINFLNKLRTEESAISGSKDLRQYLTTHPELSSMASGQHDAQEFLIKLLSLLDDDVNNTVGSVHKLKNIFGINLTQSLTCNNCHQSMHNTQVETLLALGLPDQLSTITLQALLNNLLNRPESVSDYTCEACQAPGITRTTAIKKLPEILMLSANRFGYENDQAYRINTPIFPEKNIILRDENGISSYKIMGIIAQQGTLQHGHYTAYVQDGFDGTWYLYDDGQRIDVLRDYDDKDDITAVINSSSNYVFFYKRVNQ